MYFAIKFITAAEPSILGVTSSGGTTFVAIYQNVHIDVGHLKWAFFMVVTMGNLRNSGCYGNQYLKFGKMRNLHIFINICAKKVNEVSIYM